MKKLALAAILLGTAAPAFSQGRVPSGAYDYGFPVITGGVAAYPRGVVPIDTNGIALGTSSNPLFVSGGGGGGGNGNTVDVAGSGTLALATANATYSFALTAGRSVVALRISGLTGSGAVVTAERSNDGGTTWSNANTTEQSATSSLSATITADGQARIGVGGATNIRLRVSTAGTGTASIAYNATTAPGPIFLSSLLPSTTTPGAGVIGGVNNQMIAGVTISVGAGVTDTGTQRVSLATDGNQATAARQDTGNTSLSTLAGTVAAAGSPTANAQTIQANALPLPAGASTSALQTTGNSSAANTATGIGTPTDAAATTTDTTATSVISQLKQEVVKLNTIITTLGTPFQAGGALGVGTALIGTAQIGLGAAVVSVTNTNNDGASPSSTAAGIGLVAAARSYGFNGATFDRTRTLSATDMATGLGVTAVGTIPSSAASQGLAPTTVQGTTSLVLKASAGNLFNVNVVNSTVAGFIVVANLTAAPASGTAITAAQQMYCMPVAANVGFDKTFTWPARGTAGITLLFSTSCTTYTPTGTAPISLSGAAA